MQSVGGKKNIRQAQTARKSILQLVNKGVKKENMLTPNTNPPFQLRSKITL